MKRKISHPLFVLFTAHWLVCTNAGARTTPAQPTPRPRSEFAKIIKSQAYESRLSIDGLAFLDSALYVATNVGLFEVRDRKPTQLYQWFANDNVISGPWPEQNPKRIWLKREHDDVFLIHDQIHWRLVPLPEPPNGDYYTRGDMLEGFRGIADSTGFRLMGAGCVWKWSDSGTWVVEPRPPTTDLSGTIGFAKLGNRELHVVTSGGCGYLSCVNQAFWRKDNQWGKVIHLPVANVADVLVASDNVFVRGTKGELLRIENDSAPVVPTPGPCEAIARRSDGSLIASFRNGEVFALETGNEWRKLFGSPLLISKGEQRVFLSESQGVIALATTPGDNHQPSLWISDGTQLTPVELLH